MKVSILMARGVEGCGVTKFTIEQYHWLVDNGYQAKVYASKDKSWTRKNSHEIENLELLKFAKEDEMTRLIQECNESDVVIINSLPPQSHPEESIKQFGRFLNEVKTKIVLVQHDHSSLSIKRNACINEAIDRADVIFSHSPTNDFSKLVEEKKNGGGLGAFFDEDQVEILNFQPGMNFDKVRDIYWKDVDDRDMRMNKWIGRTTSWKGYKEMFAFHNQILRKNGYITTFEGIEKSPAYLGFREISEFNPHIADKVDDITLNVDEPVYVFGPYINTEMLERMSHCGFGYQLSLLKPRFIERSIEYTHCELSCTGVVPVLRKAYGDVCKHRHYNKPLTECDNTGTIWFDENNMQPAFELLDELAKDKKLYDEYRNQAYEFYKLHQDGSYTFKEMMDKIEERL